MYVQKGLGRSAGVKHTRQSRLLCAANRQIVVVLDLHPAPRVDTVEAGQWRLPVGRVLVPLGLVHVIRHGPELRPGNIVGKGLPLGSGPGIGARLRPCQLRSLFAACRVYVERERLTIQAFFNGTMWSMSTSLAAVQVAPSYGLSQDPDVATQAELTTTLVPSRFRTYSLRDGTDKISFDCSSGQQMGAMYGKDIPSVAGALDRVPRGEQVPLIVSVVSLRGDCESRQLGLGRGR